MDKIENVTKFRLKVRKRAQGQMMDEKLREEMYLYCKLGLNRVRNVGKSVEINQLKKFNQNDLKKLKQMSQKMNQKHDLQMQE